MHPRFLAVRLRAASSRFCKSSLEICELVGPSPLLVAEPAHQLFREKPYQLIGGDFDITKNRSQQAHSNRLARVGRDRCDAAVGMFQTEMTATGSFDLKSSTFKRANELLRSYPWQTRHTAMRCTPTSSMGSADSPSSRQSSITSRT